jgi:hypothetical protein
MVHRTFWFTVGEADADEYAPLGRFEIVLYDGTYRGLLDSILEASKEPRGPKGEPNLLVVDSGTRLWDLLKDEAQERANRRARAKAQRQGGKLPDEDVDISTDLWNIAKQRWAHIITALKDQQGPSIITARLDEVMVMKGERPTGERMWKVQAEKTLPFEVDATVEMRGHRTAYLTGVRSLRYQGSPSDVEQYPDFTVEDLWVKLGMADATDRAHQTVDAEKSLAADDAVVAERRELLGSISSLPDDRKAQIAQQWLKVHHHPIGETDDMEALRALVAAIQAEAGQ